MMDKLLLLTRCLIYALGGSMIGFDLFGHSGEIIGAIFGFTFTFIYRKRWSSYKEINVKKTVE